VIAHVVVVTIDGLVPDSYVHPDAHALRVPTLRRIVAEGAWSDGARSVLPTLTYPAHTAIATGAHPGHHGIVGNRSFDPLDQNLEAWFWYAPDIQVKPIWQAAYDAGYQTALISWPVTVGARATWLVPEYWRAKHPEDLKLLRALATPGLLERVEQRFPGYAERATPPHTTDQANVDVALQVLSEGSPTLLFLHIFEVDGAQHKHGLWSAPALSAIENADRQLARLIEAVKQAGIADSTAFIVASDHGFANVTRQLNPGVLLREAGLIDVDASGKVQAWRAASSAAGGLAYIYVNGDDAAVRARVLDLFKQRASAADSGIAQVLDHEAIVERGGDPRAALALEAQLGVTFGSSLQTYEAKPSYAAAHGWDPARPEMRASLLVLGPSIKPGPLHDARLIDIAPTIAKWLQLPLPEADGAPLPLE
jgi:predicted AlkP superfamily pyrophosphatase or phosphodiesterase